MVLDDCIVMVYCENGVVKQVVLLWMRSKTPPMFWKLDFMVSVLKSTYRRYALGECFAVNG